MDAEPARIACPGCAREAGGGDDTFHCGPALRFVRCRTCGLAFRTCPESVEEAYDDRYAADIARGFRSEGKQAHARKTLRRLSRFRPGPPGRLLDVGCADGAFLLAARDAGWVAEGLERQEQNAARAREAGLTVYAPSLDALPATTPFDVITLLDVIEHVRDPRPFLETLGRHLVPQGWLYLETPNFSSLYRRALGNKWGAFILHHEILYSPEALVALLGRSGFRAERILTDNFAPFSYDGLRRLRRHETMYSLLAAWHHALIRLGLRPPGEPVRTAPGGLARVVNVPMDLLVNGALRSGDQLIVAARRT